MNRMVLAAFALLTVGTEASLTAKLEKAEPPATLAAAQRELLDPQSLAVRAEDKPVMRMWFRRAIPVRASPEQLRQGLTYRQIPEGTLVGAVELPQGFTDYRKQRIAAGVYTLRFALQPDLGEHTDTSPHPEFLLLSPVSGDRSAGEVAPRALFELSSRVNQGRHPAVLLLWPNDGSDAAVRVVDKGAGVRAVTVQRPVTAGGRRGTLGFAITVAGFRKE